MKVQSRHGATRSSKKDNYQKKRKQKKLKIHDDTINHSRDIVFRNVDPQASISSP